jgi:hypothetical protein
MKMKQVFGLLFLSLWLHACMFKGYTQNFETTVQVVDMSGAPLKNRVVKLFTSSFDSYSYPNTSDFAKVSQAGKTDANGQVVFKYGLMISDSHTDFASIVADEDSTWMMVSYPNHSVSDKKTKKQTLKVFMDSLMPIKIRLRKTTTRNLSLGVWSYSSNNAINGIDGSTRNKNISRTFASWQRHNTGVFDSVVVLKSFSKAGINISASLDSFANNSFHSNINRQSRNFQQGEKRDSVVFSF